MLSSLFVLSRDITVLVEFFNTQAVWTLKIIINKNLLSIDSDIC